MDYLMDDTDGEKSDVYKASSTYITESTQRWSWYEYKIDGVHEAMLKEILKK